MKIAVTGATVFTSAPTAIGQPVDRVMEAGKVYMGN